MQSNLQLGNIIQNLDLLAGLEGRKTEVWAAGAAESIAQGTATAGTGRLALNGEIQLGQIVRLQLQHIQILIGVCSVLLILGLETVCETACTILAGTPPPTGLGLALWG